MRGATLVELLVGLLLAGIAAAGTLGALSHVQRVWRDTERIGRLHERAQYVFGTLEPELQMAGYFGSHPRPQLSSPPGPIVSACGSNTVLPLFPAVHVLHGGWTLPCSAQGAGAQPGSDTLILRRASTRITPPDGALQLLGSVAEPGLRNLVVRIFYVSRAADGDSRSTALRVKSLSAVTGTPAFIDTEVMPGVDDLQVELLPDDLAPRSVRVRLRIRTDAADVQSRDAPTVLTLERRFNLRNAAS